MSAHSTEPEILDIARRVGRTAVQAGTAVVTGTCTLGAVYAIVSPITGPLTRENAAAWFLAAIPAVAGNAAVIARIMAVPGVNALLRWVRLDAQATAPAGVPAVASGAADTETRAIALLSAAGH